MNKKTIGIMYTYKVKGQILNVVKITDYDNNNKTYWYYTVNNGDADDWYSTKKVAKLAGEEWINENF